jgi:hypothetical protein
MALSDFAVLTAAVGFIAPAFSWRGAFADFLAHREQVKKRSPRTLEFYIWTAGDLAAWLDASAITSEAISSNVIEAWYKTHRSRAPGRRSLGNCTLHAHLRGARAFVRYCGARESRHHPAASAHRLR